MSEVEFVGLSVGLYRHLEESGHRPGEPDRVRRWLNTVTDSAQRAKLVSVVDAFTTAMFAALSTPQRCVMEALAAGGDVSVIATSMGISRARVRRIRRAAEDQIHADTDHGGVVDTLRCLDAVGADTILRLGLSHEEIERAEEIAASTVEDLST